MDPQTRELLEKNLAIAEDTNRMVHKLRRGAWWGRIFTLVFWVVLIVAPVAAYYYYFQSYIQPYAQKVEQLYTQYQQGSQQAQQYQSQLSNFFGNLMPQSATSNAPQVPSSAQ